MLPRSKPLSDLPVNEVVQQTEKPDPSSAMSRRDMLRYCATALGGIALAGCSNGSSGTTSSGTTSSGTTSSTSSTTALTPPTVKQNATGVSTASSSFAVNLGSTSTSGDYLVLAVAAAGNNPPSISSFSLAGFSLLFSSADSSKLTNLYVYGYASAPPINAVTINLSANSTNGQFAAILLDFTPATGTSISVDTFGTNGSTAAAAAGSSIAVTASTSAATTNSPDIMVAFTAASQFNAADGQLTFSNPYSLITNQGFGSGTTAKVVLAAADATVTSTAIQTFNGTVTVTTAADMAGVVWATGILALK